MKNKPGVYVRDFDHNLHLFGGLRRVSDRSVVFVLNDYDEINVTVEDGGIYIRGSGQDSGLIDIQPAYANAARIVIRHREGFLEMMKKRKKVKKPKCGGARG